MRAGTAYMHAKRVTVLGTVAVKSLGMYIVAFTWRRKTECAKAQNEIAYTTVITEANTHYWRSDHNSFFFLFQSNNQMTKEYNHKVDQTVLQLTYVENTAFPGQVIQQKR